MAASSKSMPNHVCGACGRTNMYLQAVSFIHEGYLYRTNVLVCTNKACVKRCGGTVIKHREEQGPKNMAANRVKAGG